MKVNMKFRLLSLLLVVALLVGILPVPAVYAEEAVPGEELVEQNEAEETPEGEISYVVSGELPELREESVKHFRMEDGSFIAVDYGTPVHYLDTDETWEDIDNTLLPTTSAQAQSFSAAATTQATVQASDTYTAVNGEDEKTFAADLQTGFLFSSQTGSSAVQMFLTGSGGSSVSGSAEMDQAANTGSFFSEDEMILPEDALSSDLAEDEVDETLQMGDTAVESEVSPDVTPEDTSIQEAENAWEDASDLSREELVSEDAFAVEEEVIPYNRYSSAQISYPDMPEEDEPSLLAEYCPWCAESVQLEQRQRGCPSRFSGQPDRPCTSSLSGALRGCLSRRGFPV